VCRHNQLWGSILGAFGIGLLLGTWLDGGFWSLILGLGLIFIGFCVAKKR